eukprot:COSAG05_NODE_11_length_38500_cov_831.349861_2_plen_231_part_00
MRHALVPVPFVAPFAARISESALSNLRADSLDSDGSGGLDGTEVRAMCQRMGKQLSEKEFVRAMDAMDGNGDGNVSFDEFIAWWERPTPAVFTTNLYKLGKGHAKAITSAGKWYTQNKTASDESNSALAAGTRSGYLSMKEEKATAAWEKMWFNLRPVGLEIFPTEADAVNSVHGPDYSLVPIALVGLPKATIKGMVPTGTSGTRPKHARARSTCACVVAVVAGVHAWLG